MHPIPAAAQLCLQNRIGQLHIGILDGEIQVGAKSKRVELFYAEVESGFEREYVEKDVVYSDTIKLVEGIEGQHHVAVAFGPVKPGSQKLKIRPDVHGKGRKAVITRIVNVLAEILECKADGMIIKPESRSCNFLLIYGADID